ncbi:MAG TPA: ribosome small subunit-dependent GTPase A [Gammaproteobacteria bacterium]|jgi:ribosome biogenesis GTPase|nr:ribosome small subunit-dependent GTPase A [Gammaproteobacteria bacterium]
MTRTGAAMLDGRVVAGHGRRYVVETANGTRLLCLTAGRSLQPVCGDRVQVEPDADGALIRKVLPRTSLFSKTDDRGKSIPAAANLDLVLVALAVEPRPDSFLTDKYLAAIGAMGLKPGIVFNKIDLPDASAVEADTHLTYFEKLGYPVFRLSTKGKLGLESLRTALSDKCSLLVGQSGVGKSSLLNILVPEARSRITELSAATGEGKHTTTSTTLHPLPGGGSLLDSPGVRDLSLAHCPPEALKSLFVEFTPRAGHCRFADCLHITEPSCAVRAAVENKEIPESRYKSYQRLVKTMKEVQDRKYD